MRRAFLILLTAMACTSISDAHAQSFSVCHGYGCTFKTSVTLTPAERSKIASIMAGGRKSAEAERAAVRKAVQVFERRSTDVIGIRDRPKMDFGKGREKGQMDCVDEAANTGSFLSYLQRAGQLHYHTVGNRDSRGNFVDGRYPHFTAVLRDRTGTSWAVDSWYEPAGGPPDVMRLSEWQERGYDGQR
ncbi:hypothetical protein [Phyllobacterium sp. YR531]|uniref:hypothetical protein n=1 Tax=Phyllobacterium sp. YR531 TaxID=1144343 RepID=UPI00026FA172|nr:hypothetical protein [Phyllobacterium sp. YR531]EJN03425.1 hypothetical protein PMI41_02418 [Phyllobacterium sp. YR531]